jgi:monofunctional chorismate mutase
MSNDELTRLRTDIDRLDEELIRVVALRFAATGRVGVIKAAQHLQAVDPEREAAQAQRYDALAACHGVSSELIQKVFRVVIDEVVANHRAIAQGAPKAPL